LSHLNNIPDRTSATRAFSENAQTFNDRLVAQSRPFGNIEKIMLPVLRVERQYALRRALDFSIGVQFA
jgi:hypothetical protein